MQLKTLSFVGALSLALSSVACESIKAPTTAAVTSDGKASQATSDDGIVMPTPGSVTAAEPGGDAPDKEAAALMRLASTPDRGFRSDRWETLHVRLVDPKEWRRVRIFGTPTRATFRYGDAGYALSAITYEPSDGPSDPHACLDKFMKFADDMATTYDIQYDHSPVYDREQTVDDAKKPIAVLLVEGKVTSSFMKNDYVGAVVAYQSFPGTCLVQSFAAVSTHHPDIARKARDTWVNEAAPLLSWATDIGSAPEFDSR